MNEHTVQLQVMEDRGGELRKAKERYRLATLAASWPVKHNDSGQNKFILRMLSCLSIFICTGYLH